MRGKHKEGSSSVNEMARALAQVSTDTSEILSTSTFALLCDSQVTAELESVKADMDEKGTSMTDSGDIHTHAHTHTHLH